MKSLQLSLIQNISNQLDASVSAINITFFEDLASVKTSFDSKLNNTAQNLLDADQSLQTLLNTINSSLSAQVNYTANCNLLIICMILWYQT